jgi:hypothetical protein
MEYFSQYNAQYMNSPNPSAPLIPFNPPPPTIIDGIKGLSSEELKEKSLLEMKTTIA